MESAKSAVVDSVRSAVALALRWLAARDLSSAELTLRLRRRGCPDAVIVEALEHLRKSGAVNDERVAISRARIESSSRGRGRERVLLRLRSIGIDAATARHAVEIVFGDIDERELLERAINRRLKPAGASIRTPADYRRLYSAMLRLGFPSSEIRKALDARRGPALEIDE